jgi:glycyl-tRNA synthetase beta chain
MKEFILEIYSEEIPSSMQESGASELFNELSKSLNESNISFGEHILMSSPRRIAVLIKDIPESLAETVQEFKGPKKDAPQQAIEGFAKNHSVEITDLELKNIKDVATYFYYKKIPAQSTSVILAAVLPQVLKNINWPKSQKWDDSGIRWVRPIRSILCLLGSEVIKFNFGNISSSNITFGHRFMEPEEFAVIDSINYTDMLMHKKVIAFAATRKQQISEQIAAITASNNLSLIEDNTLLDEVNGLVEYPNALLGQIEEKYMGLPPEVLITSMRHHQKIFCLTNNGKLSNKFITIANVSTDDDTLIIEGNQKVVGARLADAKFFWDEDCKKTLQEHAKSLSRVVFHKEIGSVFEKTKRIEKIAKFISSKYLSVDAQLITQASIIIKADLVTEMVGEFPELQGVIGKYYATFHNEHESVALAALEHYKPVTQYDSSPTNALSVIMSLADKIDSLVGLWIAGEKPTGSKDPYALRRSALTIIKLILDSKITANLSDLIVFTADLFTTYLKFDAQKSTQEIIEFIMIRLKQYFKNNGFKDHVIEAFVINNLDICKIEEKIILCSNFIQDQNGKKAIYSVKRILNILESLEDKNIDAEINESLLTRDQEIALYKKLMELKKISQQMQAKDLIASSFEFITILSPFIDDFFDHVIVNDQDDAIKLNRVILLTKIKKQVIKLGDFTKLEV